MTNGWFPCKTIQKASELLRDRWTSVVSIGATVVAHLLHQALLRRSYCPWPLEYLSSPQLPTECITDFLSHFSPIYLTATVYEVTSPSVREIVNFRPSSSRVQARQLSKHHEQALHIVWAARRSERTAVSLLASWHARPAS